MLVAALLTAMRTMVKMTFDQMPLIDSDAIVRELQAIAAEAISWQPLANGTYLHTAPREDEAPVITIIGAALDADLLGNYLLLL